jgi:methylmalonyl-CoA mutase N-terminal domain/subunit
LGAVLGGANSIQTCAYDEALSIPSEEAAILSLRTQQIIRHEPNIVSVSDPLAGSFYVESLTHQLEEKALQMIDQIEERDGFIKYWERGLFRKELEDVAYQGQENLNKQERVIVGVNRHVSTEGREIPLFRHDPRVEKVASERVRSFRSHRDSAKTQQALTELKDVSEKVKGQGSKETPMVMEALINAARSNATFGEMAGKLKEVFGWGISY